MDNTTKLRSCCLATLKDETVQTGIAASLFIDFALYSRLLSSVVGHQSEMFKYSSTSKGSIPSLTVVVDKHTVKV